MKPAMPIRLTVVQRTIPVQVGCEQCSYCYEYAYDYAFDYASFREPTIDYPLLPTAARLRVRAIGVAVAEWEYFGSVAWQQVEQRQYVWVVIPVTTNRGAQDVRIDCSKS